MASSGASLQRTTSKERAFPPGLGYTPTAGATPLSKRSPFGFGEGIATPERSISEGTAPPPATAPTPMHLKREASIRFDEDGTICKEMLLLVKESVASTELSAAEAGFVWPLPGWLKCEDKDPSPASKQTLRNPGKPGKPGAKPQAAAQGKAPAALVKQPTQVLVQTAVAAPPGQLVAAVAPGQVLRTAIAGQTLGTRAPLGNWLQTQTQAALATASAFASPPTQSLGFRKLSVDAAEFVPAAAGKFDEQKVFAEAVTQSLGAQQFQRQAVGPQSFSTAPTQSWGTQQFSGQAVLQQQPRQQQNRYAQWQGGDQSSGASGDDWSWTQQATPSAAAPKKGSGKRGSKAQGQARGY